MAVIKRNSSSYPIVHLIDPRRRPHATRPVTTRAARKGFRAKRPLRESTAAPGS
jgi:hypothetical protein